MGAGLLQGRVLNSVLGAKPSHVFFSPGTTHSCFTRSPTLAFADSSTPVLTRDRLRERREPREGILRPTSPARTSGEAWYSRASPWPGACVVSCLYPRPGASHGSCACTPLQRCGDSLHCDQTIAGLCAGEQASSQSASVKVGTRRGTFTGRYVSA